MYIVTRLLQYDYPDADTALADMENWQVPANGSRKFGRTARHPMIRSAVIGPFEIPGFHQPHPMEYALSQAVEHVKNMPPTRPEGEADDTETVTKLRELLGKFYAEFHDESLAMRPTLALVERMAKDCEAYQKWIDERVESDKKENQ